MPTEWGSSRRGYASPVGRRVAKGRETVGDEQPTEREYIDTFHLSTEVRVKGGEK